MAKASPGIPLDRKGVSTQLKSERIGTPLMGPGETHMPPKRKTSLGKPIEERVERPIEGEVQAVLAWLERHGTESESEGMARYGIPSDNAFGVPVGALRQHAKGLGRNHELAVALWDTGWYEARMLASFIDEPAQVTRAQMDRWCRDFDNWAICDTACFHLFDRTPHAWDKVEQWSRRRGELAKRAAFALLACLALHDKQAGDEPFLRSLALIEGAATDERNFVKKGVSWALHAIGERNPELNAAAVTVARRLADSPQAAARWVGRDTLKKLTRPATTRRLAAQRRPAVTTPATHEKETTP